MSRWHVELVAKDGASRPDMNYDALDSVLTPYVTSLSWSHSIGDPYSDASISALIPLRDLALLELGHVVDGVIKLHASAFLRISEATGNGNIERFYGPVTSVTSGIKVDSTLGTRQTAPITITASTWLTPLMRGFLVSSQEGLEVGTSIIPYETWQSIANAVLESASQRGLTDSLEAAWDRLGIPVVGGTTLSGYEYSATRASSSDKYPQRSVDVQGRNLSQLQPPAAEGTIWGVIKSTFQASPLVELFPAYIHDPITRETTRHIVYRLRSPAPRYFEGTGNKLLSEYKGQQGQTPSFYSSAYKTSAVYEAPDVMTYSLRYPDTRNNYIELTSPYTGTGQLAGLSSDPLYHKGDIEAYGLFKYSVSYPYIRSEDKSIREELNELNRHAAITFGMANRYASGTLVTKYVDGTYLSHGDYVRWRSYGPEKHFYEGYITRVSHTLTVNDRGTLEGKSEYTLERVEAIVTGTSRGNAILSPLEPAVVDT